MTQHKTEGVVHQSDTHVNSAFAGILVCITLTDEYELDLGAKTQPSINIDDLLFSTYHLMAIADVHRTMMTSTSACPGTLVESSGQLRVLMKVTHRLNKGKRNKGVPPVFTYTERNDNLGLCVIQDIFSRQGSIEISGAISDIPVFRRSMKDSEAQEYEIAASKSTGFKNPGSLYKCRKGAAANLRHPDEHSRNNIMDPKRSGTFAHYYVQVRDDTQSAFTETPARDALLKLSSNASLTRDISAPRDLTDQQKQELELRSNTMNSFDNIGNHIIEQNYQGKPLKFEPDVSHVVPERKALTDLETCIDDVESVEDRIQSLELRLALHSLNVPKTLQKRIWFNNPPAPKDIDMLEWN
ncbi:FluG domain protein [Elaphomyces granulatus]